MTFSNKKLVLSGELNSSHTGTLYEYKLEEFNHACSVVPRVGLVFTVEKQKIRKQPMQKWQQLSKGVEAGNLFRYSTCILSVCVCV